MIETSAPLASATFGYEKSLQGWAMDDGIQLISDGDGLTVIGNPSLVERFLASEKLLSLSMDIGPRLLPLLRLGAGVTRAGSEIAARSSRWVKLTEESAQRVKELGLIETKTPGISHAMVGQPGAIKSWLQITEGPGSLLTNPATLAGIAGIMAQVARQHEMNAIKSHLARIDKKVDLVLDAQKDAELKKVIGAGIDIEAAMATREPAARIDAITWSTVQGRTHTITDALGWVLLRLDALAERVEGAPRIGDLARTTGEAESEARELLAVLARCLELQDALDVLRLDRVLDELPDRVDGQRLALNAERQKRRELISRRTGHLMARMEATAGTADSKVLLHLPASRAVVESINRIGMAVDDFHELLGMGSERHPLKATRWWDAARDPGQLKNAAAEAGRKALIGAGVVSLSLAATAWAKSVTEEK